MSFALNKLRWDEHFEGVDFFQTFVVGDEQGRFALDRRSDLQSIRQPNGVARPHQSRSFGKLLVNGDMVSVEKDFKVNLISSTKPYFFSARGLARTSASVMVDVTAVQAMAAQ